MRLTNYSDHPENDRYIVFHFNDPKMAGEFMDELTMAAIPFEEDDSGGPPYLIGIKKTFQDKALKVNYIVIGRHRQPFIADKVFRWLVLVVVGFAMLLAVLGILNRQ